MVEVVPDIRSAMILIARPFQATYTSSVTTLGPVSSSATDQEIRPWQWHQARIAPHTFAKS